MASVLRCSHLNRALNRTYIRRYPLFYEKIGGFEIRAFFDKQQHKLINKVTYRRKLLPTQVLDDRLSQSYIGYTLILADLKNVVAWGNIALGILEQKEITSEQHAILNSLLVSIVTTYWKCFADTKGRHGVRLNVKQIQNEYKFIHHEIRRIRHNYAAHSGDDPFESGYVLHVEDIVGKNRFEPFTIPIHRRANHGDKKLTSNIIKLSESLIESIHLKQEKILEKIKESTV